MLNQYVLLSKIGAGGMGQVFKAQHRKMKRLAAIKLLPAALTKDEAAVKRFQREVEAAAKLSHPNIVQTHDADECRGIHYMVMECVDGQDLSALVKQNGPLPVDNAVDYILQAARGLAFAHAEGVVHRDIKPANLLLDNEGVVKILDMGLARIDDGNTADHQLTNTGTVMGTVDYMPPEQANDTRRADARSDVYSLGCSLYRILTGESVFGGETVVQKIMAHMGDPIPSLLSKRPDCPAEIDRIFQKMLAKRPDDRYQQSRQVVAELEAWRNPGATTSFSGSTAASQDANLNEFLRSVGGAKPAGSQSSAAVKTATKHTVIGAPEQTAAYSGAELQTDPKSEIVPSLVTNAKPSPAAAKPKSGGKGGKKPPMKLIAAGAAGSFVPAVGRDPRHQERQRRDRRGSESPRRQHRRGEAARRRLGAGQAGRYDCRRITCSAEDHHTAAAGHADDSGRGRYRLAVKFVNRRYPRRGDCTGRSSLSAGRSGKKNVWQDLLERCQGAGRGEGRSPRRDHQSSRIRRRP